MTAQAQQSSEATPRSMQAVTARRGAAARTRARPRATVDRPPGTPLPGLAGSAFQVAGACEVVQAELGGGHAECFADQRPVELIRDAVQVLPTGYVALHAGVGGEAALPV